MRKMFIVTAALFLTASMAQAADNYVAAGVGVGSVGTPVSVSAGTKFAPSVGLSVDATSYGAHAGHGVTAEALGFLPVTGIASVFGGVGVSRQSLPGASHTGGAYSVGLQSEPVDFLIRVAATRAATVNSVVLSIGHKF